jgi:hypothetical protein
MKHNIFISYPKECVDIVENLRDHLKRYGVNAWVYSLDRTLAADTWKEIEAKIVESDLVIFAVSQYTAKAKGQHRELELAVNKVISVTGTDRIAPLMIDGTDFSFLPPELQNKNGDYLDGHTVKSVAYKIATRLFPETVEEELAKPWKFPIPGQWLEVSKLDEILEHYFELGDKLYFRSISPMGLFECYSPKLKELFWIHPENVKFSKDVESDHKLEKEMPRIYGVSGMTDILRFGWDFWNESQSRD